MTPNVFSPARKPGIKTTGRLRDTGPLPYRVAEQAPQLEPPPGFGQRPAPTSGRGLVGAEDEPFTVRAPGVSTFGRRHGRGRAVSWRERSCLGAIALALCFRPPSVSGAGLRPPARWFSQSQ
jgi:hypothetical protein